MNETHKPPSEAVLCREAILEFLTEVHPLLPPYWYNLDGDDVGSLAFLFGLTQEKLEALFLRAGILKPKGERLQYQRNIVDEMLSLDIHNTKVWSLGIGVMNDWGQIGRHMVLVYLLFSLGACLF